MDRQVAILTYASTRDAAGGVVETWTEGATVPAEKADQTGREFQAAAQTNAEMTTRFWLRWRSDITAKGRLLCEGVVYDIKAIREVGRRDGLEITATGRV
jgi:SPP1 family predicted phage head-tail adaptor